MISEGSCDTEDWSNDAENSALQHTVCMYVCVCVCVCVCIYIYVKESSCYKLKHGMLSLITKKLISTSIKRTMSFECTDIK